MFNHDEEMSPAGAGYVIKIVAIAAAMMLASIAAYFWWGRVPPAAEGRIVSVTPFQVHYTAGLTTSNDNNPLPNLPFLVLTNVTIRNVGKKPLPIFEIAGILSMNDTGSDAEYKSLDVTDADFSRVFQHYPELASQQKAHIPEHTVLQPGETRDGLLIFHYPSLDQWKQKKSFRVVVSFGNERDLALTEGTNQAE